MVLREVSKIDVNYVKKLYKEAFPIRERMPFSRLLKLQKNNIIKMFAAYENGESCALAITCTGSKSVKPLPTEFSQFRIHAASVAAVLLRS